MADGFLAEVVAWMSGVSPLWIYATVFAIAYLENVVPPIPGDMVIVFGGYLAGLGVVGFVPTAVLATAGGALGFMTMYAIGWRFGLAVEDPERLRWIPKPASDRARRWIRRYGYGVVAVNRFLSGVRSVIALSVGAARMDPAQTALWATVSSGLWCSLIAGMGYVVGENWAVIGEWLRLYGLWVSGVLTVVAAGALLRWAWRRRRGEEPSREATEAAER